MKKSVQVYTCSILKACRSHVHVVGGNPNISSSPPPQVTTTTTTSITLVGPSQLTRMAANISPPSPPYGNPCLDLFFHVKPPNACTASPQYSREYLKQLLPQAWSHSPIMTLKLICHLLDVRGGKNDREGFYTAAYWLYQNHPKTLACNVAPIASLGSLTDLLHILHLTLEGEDQYVASNVYKAITYGIGGSTSSRKRRQKIFSMANKAIEKYRLDPNYRSLHDGVSNLYAQLLKSDIQNLNNYHTIINDDDDDDDGDDDNGGSHESKCLEITSAATNCPNMDSSLDRATLLCESIAKMVFPRDSNPEYQGLEEADYAYKVRKKLRDEVLVPLRKALEPSGWNRPNRWGYDPGFKPEPCAVQTYLEEVKAAATAGGKCEIKAGALLPNEIIGFLVKKNAKDNNDDDVDLVAAAELQWKTMVEEMYLKQGKFKNCVAVCDVYPLDAKSMEASVSLGILLSQLSEEPWNGKVITFNRNPQLFSIQGHDLKSKCEFMSTMDGKEWDREVYVI